MLAKTTAQPIVATKSCMDHCRLGQKRLVGYFWRVMRYIMRGCAMKIPKTPIYGRKNSEMDTISEALMSFKATARARPITHVQYVPDLGGSPDMETENMSWISHWPRTGPLAKSIKVLHHGVCPLSADASMRMEIAHLAQRKTLPQSKLKGNKSEKPRGFFGDLGKPAGARISSSQHAFRKVDLFVSWQ